MQPVVRSLRSATSPRAAVSSEIPVLFRIPDAALIGKSEKEEATTASPVASAFSRAIVAAAEVPTAVTEAPKPTSAAVEVAPKATTPATLPEPVAAAVASPVAEAKAESVASRTDLPSTRTTSEKSAEPLSKAVEPFSSRRRFSSAASDTATTTKAANTEQIKDTTPPTDAAAPSTLERARLRERRQQEEVAPPAASGNWFQTQGKFIAICFVIALIGTVCLARYKRNKLQQAPSQMAREESTPVDVREKSAAVTKPTEPAAQTVKQTSGVSPASSTAPSLIPEVSPATNDGGPDFTASPASTETPDSKSLFPWKGDGSQDRTATRPDAPVGTPAYSPAGTEAEAPASSPAYPETSPDTHRTIDPENPNQLRQGTKPKSGTLRSDSGNSQPNPSTISGIRYER